jgi:hypothetical protein
LLKDVKAVSEAENKAENPMRHINIINWIIVVESTAKHTPAFYFKSLLSYLIYFILPIFFYLYTEYSLM